jgi:5-methylcytosine-specific restriction endonuclease McrA
MSDCLILNADAQPVSVLPLSIINWQDAITYLVLNKAVPLEWHEDWIVRSAVWETRVPAVMILRDYMKTKSYVRFSKNNIFLRDDFSCQYCGTEVTKKTATLDHVLPTSHGGKTSWENCSCACSRCNSAKGNDKRIKPKRVPHKPTYWELVEKRKKLGFDVRHESWKVYLS